MATLGELLSYRGKYVIAYRRVDGQKKEVGGFGIIDSIHETTAPGWDFQVSIKSSDTTVRWYVNRSDIFDSWEDMEVILLLHGITNCRDSLYNYNYV